MRDAVVRNAVVRVGGPILWGAGPRLLAAAAALGALWGLFVVVTT